MGGGVGKKWFSGTVGSQIAQQEDAYPHETKLPSAELAAYSRSLLDLIADHASLVSACVGEGSGDLEENGELLKTKICIDLFAVPLDSEGEQALESEDVYSLTPDMVDSDEEENPLPATHEAALFTPGGASI